MQEIEERLTNLEMCVADQERTIDELNAELIRLNRVAEQVTRQYKWLIEQLQENPVKPLSEETPPPHY